MLPTNFFITNMAAVSSNEIFAISQMDPIPLEDLIAMNVEWKEGHGKNISIIRSVFAITSTISSCTLIWMITRSHKGLSTTHHRILLALSICDFISSLGYSTFNFTSPSDSEYLVWNARGDEASCDAQGFLVLLGMSGGLFYNASLNLYYLAVVKFGKSEDYIRTKIEPFLYGVPILLSLTYSIVGLARNHSNDDGYGVCSSVVHYPPYCYGYELGEVRDCFKIPCGRGSEGAESFLNGALVLMCIPVIIMIASLVIIYRTVKEQENKLSKYGIGALTLDSHQHRAVGTCSLWKRIKMVITQSSLSTNSHHSIRSNIMQSQSRAIMHKAFQYSFAWFLSYGIFVPFLMIPDFPTTLLYIVGISMPLQGFFNLCIYMYPKVVSARKRKRGQENMKVSLWQAISEAFWSRGKKRKRNLVPRTQSSANLRGNRNRPFLRTRNHTDGDTHGMMKSPQFSREKITKDKHTRCREPQEEEKGEIQSSTDLQNVSHLTFAPSLTHDVPDTHHVMNCSVEEVREGASLEARDEGSGNEEFLDGLNDNTKQDEFIIPSEGKNADITKDEYVRTSNHVIKE